MLILHKMARPYLAATRSAASTNEEFSQLAVSEASALPLRVFAEPERESTTRFYVGNRGAAGRGAD